MGRLPALLTAERLSEGWDRVTLVTSSVHPGEGEGLTTAYPLIRSLAERGVTLIDRARLGRIEGRRVLLRGVFDEARGPVGEVDAIVSLTGCVSEDGLAGDLAATGVRTLRIGDAKPPRNAADAVSDAVDVDGVALTAGAD